MSTELPPEVLEKVKAKPENWKEKKDKNAMVGVIYVDLMKGPYIVFVTRLEWFSLAPRYEEVPGDATSLRTPVTNVRVYCTGGPPCLDNTECIERVQKIQDYDMKERNLPDIAPNFLIGSDGIVYEGRGWTKEATRSTVDFPDFQGNCLDFAYIGDYKKTGKRPKWAMVRSLMDMIMYGVKHEKISLDPPWDLSGTLLDMIIYGIKYKKIRSWFKIHNYDKTDVQPYRNVGV